MVTNFDMRTSNPCQVGRDELWFSGRRDVPPTVCSGVTCAQTARTDAGSTIDLTYSWHWPDIRVGFFVFLVRAFVIDPRINGSPSL
jgi:hypothetical protein